MNPVELLGSPIFIRSSNRWVFCSLCSGRVEVDLAHNLPEHKKTLCPQCFSEFNNAAYEAERRILDKMTIEKHG
jgi:hypothetical protein